MNVLIVSFFNNKGEVGKTSLGHHIAWMLSELGEKVLVFDLDLQANLTAVFLQEDEVEKFFEDSSQPHTIYGCLSPLIRGSGDFAKPKLRPITDTLALLPGNLTLCKFEDQLSECWPK